LPTPQDVQPHFLTAACAAARWIVSRQSAGHWPSRPDESIEDHVDFYYGNAGTILFFRELAESTADHSYQEIAFHAADYLAAQMERVTDCGFFHGLAGMAFTLDQPVNRDGLPTWGQARMARRYEDKQNLERSLLRISAFNGLTRWR
jgi:Lanthionine synthetase C-like protein